MKSLSHVGEFFRRKDHALALKLRVASALNVFVAIRGLEALLNSGTAVVMRKGYETLVIQDASAIDNRENVLALVHVKDMECYNRLLTIQTNRSFHRGKLDRTISNDLADEIAKQLLKEAGKIDNGTCRIVSKVYNYTIMNIGDIIAFALFLIVVVMGFLLSFYLLRHKR